MQLVKNVVLIGPMGSAKTTCAKLISQSLNAQILDCDEYFEKLYGSIPEFFIKHGEAEFRKKEEEILVYASGLQNTVIATGGGAVLSAKGMNELKNTSLVIYLYADNEILSKRIGGGKSRPLSGDAAKIFDYRRQLYQGFAHYAVDNSAMDKNTCAQKLLDIIKGANAAAGYDIALLDSDDTLLDFTASQDIAIRRTFADNNIKLPDYAYSLFGQINDGLWIRLERGEIEKSFIFTERFRLLGCEVGIEFDCQKLSDYYFEMLANVCVLNEGARELLLSLKAKNVRRYVITNGVKYSSMGRLSPLKDLLDGIFISEDIGYEKPDRRFFDFVVKAVGADISRMIVLGDRESSDIKGATGYGIHCCLYDPSGQKETAAELRVRTLPEFADLV